MASGFETELGVNQGRIAVTAAPEGTYVYELGHALNHERDLALGDYHEVKQDVVLDPSTVVVYVTIVITAPDSLPSGFGWKVSGKLNGFERTSREIIAGRLPRTITDMAISTIGANGPPSTDEIAFRLEVVPA